ncbi:MAG: hypothetical protein H7328_05820 [Bdellovibrio sp.]|nr:hypothetical protein [Bdellovibrio sp.]
MTLLNSLHGKFKIGLNVLVAALFLYLVSTVLAKASTIGGPDFFFYVLNGRDLSEGNQLGIMRYLYFPGVYWVWRFAIDLLGKDLETLQNFYVGILILSAVLSSLCVYILSKKLIPALVTGSVYIALLHLLEGFGGCIEPIAAVTMLIGLTAYIYFAKKEKFWIATLIIITFFALTLLMKQQGLVFAVAAFVLVFYPTKRFFELHWLNFVVPPLIIATFLGLMFLEGGGIEAIKIAFGFASAYIQIGTFDENLSRFFKTIMPLVVIPLLVWLPFFVARILHASHSLFVLATRLTVFCIIAGGFSLYQFRIRDYLHYGIYTIPSLALLVGLSTAFIIETWGLLTFQQKKFYSWVAVSIFFYSNYLWRSELDKISSQIQTGWGSPISYGQNRLSDICSRLTSRKVLILPPRANEFHWVCDTTSGTGKWGYSWFDENPTYYIQLIENKYAKNVLLFDKKYGYFENELLSRPAWVGIEAKLLQNGYREIYSSPFGHLYALP